MMVTARVACSNLPTGREWRVGNLTRASALAVSQVDGRPSYGGTPADASVIAAIQDLKARGLKVTLYPFIMMDVPATNTLENPYGGTGQPAYPWRGQITCTPATDVAGSVDGTAAAAEQVNSFFGTATAAQFSISGGQVNYSGSEFSFRRFILHLAHLAKAAGGVDSFIIGSEMPALTRVRAASGIYPAVAKLTQLGEDARAVLGGDTKLTYAADWTEYGAHVRDGGAEVRFPLDPLWASPDIDAVGIDWYAPCADWRDGAGHRDAQAGHGIYDRDYLCANVTGGEAYDWYYASDSARNAQDRSPITDGLGKPWVFRQKDIVNWWGEPHVERVGGVELPSPTAWVPRSKPVWLTETGCGAVDKGANAPNVFPDPKSSLDRLPYFSSGARDDLMQRRMLEAVISRWDVRMQGFESGSNPHSPLYDGAMLDPDRIYLWTWDARPFPVFPQARDIWSDGKAHETGHWLTGRFGQAPLSDLCKALLERAGVMDSDTSDVEGIADGYVIDRLASAREMLEPLVDLFAIAPLERDGRIVLRQRGKGGVRLLGADDLAVEDNSADPHHVRGQESELPAELSIGFNDTARDFQPAAVTAARFDTRARGKATADTAIVMDRAEAEKRAQIRLADIWIGRETLGLHLPPTELGLEAGDLLRLEGSAELYEVAEIADGFTRRIGARRIVPDIFRKNRPQSSSPPLSLPLAPSPPLVIPMDIPAADAEPPVLTRVAVAARPWPGAVVLWRDNGGSFEPVLRCEATAIVGETLDTLAQGALWRWDRGASVTVQLVSGELQSASGERLLAGANLGAIGSGGSDWELIQFGNAELVAPRTYRLSNLLRGLFGTETKMLASRAAQSLFVLLDDAVVPLATGVEAIDRPQSWRAAAAGKDVADPFATFFAFTPTSTALKPRAPVHLKAKRVSEGIRIRWIRRTRVNGDNWNTLDVPLGEQSEHYRVEVLDGPNVRRTMTVSQPEALYTTAAELADFGAPQAVLHVRVAQMSAQAGAGDSAEALLPLD